MHGHTWHVEVTVRGDVNPDSNSVMDFSDLGAILKTKVFDRLDHKFINDVLQVQDATSEFLARWIWDEMEKGLHDYECSLHAVTVQETENSWAEYNGD